MALIDEIKEEIKQAHMPKAQSKEVKKAEKKCRHKTKAEIEAYIARKQAEEERRMLAQQGAAKPRRGRRPKVHEPEKECVSEIQDAPVAPEKKRERKKKPESYCSKYRPKHVQTIDLPDGGSLVVIYMSGVS